MNQNEPNRQTDRQTDRQTNKQINRFVLFPVDGWIDGGCQDKTRQDKTRQDKTSNQPSINQSINQSLLIPHESSSTHPVASTET
ncbi:hypothetical protein BO70DRAFT_86691 [Aspergillus heteromorphus CBS 117.55]|uniref:Uncharacterized protein n=1 Tax=Aspergillus heteromorphus CBS 117.55 TaxID=1448321 RepID=A0A317WXR5_9EURO|nr:uncharacterized protein BO70DRAFT_86691 [Aspergillus heteromorphus CBS 117.55]PWY91153.1 hypothetical protein BO70DRAFT_86691 [Aspergillus heteromorphus CBS 117.55]